LEAAASYFPHSYVIPNKHCGTDNHLSSEDVSLPLTSCLRHA